jgi:hypothetical protein
VSPEEAKAPSPPRPPVPAHLRWPARSVPSKPNAGGLAPFPSAFESPGGAALASCSLRTASMASTTTAAAAGPTTPRYCLRWAREAENADSR